MMVYDVKKKTSIRIPNAPFLTIYGIQARKGLINYPSIFFACHFVCHHNVTRFRRILCSVCDIDLEDVERKALERYLVVHMYTKITKKKKKKNTISRTFYFSNFKIQCVVI